MSRSKQALTIELAILGFLRDQPLHGYEVYQRLTAPAALGVVWPLKQSQFYALVTRLEAEGYLSVTLDPRGTLPPRKLLQLTSTGRAAFIAWVHAAPALEEDRQRAFLARLYFARQLGPATLRQLLLRQRQQRRTELQALRAELAARHPHSYPWLISQWQVRQAEAALDWLDTFGAPPPAPGVAYPIAPLADSSAALLARQFVAYVCGPAGQAILARFGFLPAGEAAPGSLAPELPRPLRGDLLVFAASSLTEAFAALGSAFRAVHPEVSVLFTFGGSQALAEALAEGAICDVYASAHQEALAAVVATGRISVDAIRTFAHNQLAIVTPMQGQLSLESLSDLARPGLRLALGSPATAIGRYTQEVLANAAREGSFGADGFAAVLHNVICYAETVTAVLAKVAQGEVDAGIVFTSDYHRAAGAVQLTVVPPLP